MLLRNSGAALVGVLQGFINPLHPNISMQILLTVF